MFARLFAVASLAAVVFAQECPTGPINCCNGSMQASDLHTLLSQFGLVSAVLGSASGTAYYGCSPVSGVGVGDTGSSCSQQPICCNDNTFGGLVGVGCSPINVNV